jgi:hypothetical protein
MFYITWSGHAYSFIFFLYYMERACFTVYIVFMFKSGEMNSRSPSRSNSMSPEGKKKVFGAGTMTQVEDEMSQHMMPDDTRTTYASIQTKALAIQACGILFFCALFSFKHKNI